MLPAAETPAQVGRARPAPGHGLPALPARVAGLINPTVLAERRSLVEARLADDARTRVLRRRCAQIVADHLLSTIETAHAPEAAEVVRGARAA